MAARFVGTEGAVFSDGGEGCETLHPDSRVSVVTGDPSLRVTVQSAGAVKGDCRIRKLPEVSLRPIATPSTVMSREASAVPSIRSSVPSTAARETETAATAGSDITRKHEGGNG